MCLVRCKKLDFSSAKYSNGKRRFDVLRFLLPEEMFPTRTAEVPLCIAKENRMARIEFSFLSANPWLKLLQVCFGTLNPKVFI